ncbi:hypothetical protein CRG98_008251, partial [Punica granatum]
REGELECRSGSRRLWFRVVRRRHVARLGRRGQFLTMRMWEPLFKPSKATFSALALWGSAAKATNGVLLRTKFSRRWVARSGRCLTALGARAQFARLCIQGDLTKPLSRVLPPLAGASIGEASKIRSMPPRDSTLERVPAGTITVHSKFGTTTSTKKRKREKPTLLLILLSSHPPTVSDGSRSPDRVLGKAIASQDSGCSTINHGELLVIEERIIEVRPGFPRMNGSHNHRGPAEAILALHQLSQEKAEASPGLPVVEYLLQVRKAFCSSPQPSNELALDAPDGWTPPDSLPHVDNQHGDQAVDDASEDPSRVYLHLRHALAYARGKFGGSYNDTSLLYIPRASPNLVGIFRIIPCGNVSALLNVIIPLLNLWIVMKSARQPFLLSPIKYKAPGPDGLQLFFYHKYLSIVEPSVLSIVDNFLCNLHIPVAVNRTLISLIPKTKSQK